MRQITANNTLSSFAGWLEVKFGDVQHFLHGLQKWSQCHSALNLYFSLMSSRGRLCFKQKCDFWSLSKVFLDIGCFSLISRCCSLVSERFQRSVFELWIIPVLCRHSLAKSCIFGLFVISSLSHKNTFIHRSFSPFLKNPKDNTVKQHQQGDSWRTEHLWRKGLRTIIYSWRIWKYVL